MPFQCFWFSLQIIQIPNQYALIPADRNEITAVRTESDPVYPIFVTFQNSWLQSQIAGSPETNFHIEAAGSDKFAIGTKGNGLDGPVMAF